MSAKIKLATERILKQVENLCALLGGRNNLNVGNSRISDFRQNEMPACSIDNRFDESTEQNIGLLLRKSIRSVAPIVRISAQ